MSEKHNHVTRDIKPYGQCPACDASQTREPGEVAEALIAHAGRVKDLRSRSVLLAASRLVDLMLAKNIALERQLAELRESLTEETAHVWTDPDTGDLVVWAAHPPPSAPLHRRQVTPWVRVEAEERVERKVRPPQEALRASAVQPGAVLRSQGGSG